MIVEHVQELLDLVAGYDRQTTPPTALRAWYDGMDSVNFEDAKTAIRQHYRTTGKRITVADVIRGAEHARRARLRPPVYTGRGADRRGARANAAMEEARRIVAAAAERYHAEHPDPEMSEVA